MSDAAANNDHELWREVTGDYYAPSLHVTDGGGIGMNVGGLVIVRPIRDWHSLAADDRDRQRLDWLQENGWAEIVDCENGVQVGEIYAPDPAGETLRECIDRAMRDTNG